MLQIGRAVGCGWMLKSQAMMMGFQVQRPDHKPIAHDFINLLSFSPVVCAPSTHISRKITLSVMMRRQPAMKGRSMWRRDKDYGKIRAVLS